MKNKFVLYLAVITISVTTCCPAFANVYGGWDEETGYFDNASEYNEYLDGNLNLKASSPDSHRGKREKKVISGTTNARAHGWTTWEGYYHYTRARMEDYTPFFGTTILTDSGRKYGWNKTEAISPWWKYEDGIPGRAHTYYGRDVE